MRRAIWTKSSAVALCYPWSSADPLLESAAGAFDGRLVAVVLTGAGSDGAAGVRSVKAHGGVVIAQDRETSEHWSMPEAAVKSGAVDYVLPLDAIGPALDAIVHDRPVVDGGDCLFGSFGEGPTERQHRGRGCSRNP